jgi:hypothetical protein
VGWGGGEWRRRSAFVRYRFRTVKVLRAHARTQVGELRRFKADAEAKLRLLQQSVALLSPPHPEPPPPSAAAAGGGGEAAAELQERVDRLEAERRDMLLRMEQLAGNYAHTASALAAERAEFDRARDALARDQAAAAAAVAAANTAAAAAAAAGRRLRAIRLKRRCPGRQRPAPLVLLESSGTIRVVYAVALEE